MHHDGNFAQMCVAECCVDALCSVLAMKTLCGAVYVVLCYIAALLSKAAAHRLVLTGSATLNVTLTTSAACNHMQLSCARSCPLVHKSQIHELCVAWPVSQGCFCEAAHGLSSSVQGATVISAPPKWPGSLFESQHARGALPRALVRY